MSDSTCGRLASRSSRVAPHHCGVYTITAAFALVPDLRRRQGTRSSLPAILTLALAAILCNHRSLLAIAEWGAAQPPATKLAVGFPQQQTPHVSTLQRLFRRLDPACLAAALTSFFDPRLPRPVRARGSQGIAIDGKAYRGRLPFEATRTHGSMPSARYVMRSVLCWPKLRLMRSSTKPS